MVHFLLEHGANLNLTARCAALGWVILPKVLQEISPRPPKMAVFG